MYIPLFHHRKLLKHLILLVALTVLSGCSELEKEEELATENMRTVAADYALAYEKASPFQLFFKEEGSSNTSFTEETFRLSESHVETVLKLSLIHI